MCKLNELYSLTTLNKRHFCKVFLLKLRDVSVQPVLSYYFNHDIGIKKELFVDVINRVIFLHKKSMRQKFVFNNSKKGRNFNSLCDTHKTFSIHFLRCIANNMIIEVDFHK